MTFLIMQGAANHIPLRDESVQCVVTSPPYWGLRDYGTATWEGGDPDCDHRQGRNGSGRADGVVDDRGQRNRDGVGALTRNVCLKCGARRIDKQLGLEPVHDCLGWATGNPCGECYVCHMVAVFREVKRVLRKDGVVWLNLGDSFASTPSGAIASSGLQGGQSGQVAFREATKHKAIPVGLKPKDLVGIPWRVAFALQADGWWLRSAIVWAKGISFCDTYSGSVMPESVTDRPTKAHEDIFLLTKSARYFYDHEAVKEAAEDVRGTQRFSSRRAVGGMGIDATGNEGRASAEQDHRSTTRNLRDVWAISPTPYKAAHFATFSPSLVEPCVKAGTSERGCCPRCGAPWERVVEKELVVQYECRHGGYHAKGNAQGMVDLSQSWTPGANHVTTLGWRPTCGCPAHEPVPCTVLDPFAGAGTVPMVADRLGRRGVGVELSSEYCAMARQRCYGDAPLLAWAEASS